MPAKAKIGVLGASGYTGAELLRLLLRHPQAEIALLTADRRAGKPMAEISGIRALCATDADRDRRGDWAALGLDLVFCALPHGTTQKVIKDLLARAPATKVVDLSADFRLADPRPMRAGTVSACRAGTAEEGGIRAHRNLSDDIKAAQLVANPGCYTSCAELPLIPLLKASDRRTKSSSTPNRG